MKYQPSLTAFAFGLFDLIGAIAIFSYPPRHWQIVILAFALGAVGAITTFCGLVNGIRKEGR